jgi:stearoyl-CoA desaturase (delta-9 desaturase)
VSDKYGVLDKPGPDWTNIIFISMVHLTAVAGIIYSIANKFSWWTVGLTGLWLVLSGLSITGGYHRLFAHRAYKCNPLVKLFYLFFGAAAVQNSALKWATDHRRHHQHTDHEEDPYNIKKGFWWAHIGWVLRKVPKTQANRSLDLENDPLIKFQHKFYVPLAILMAGLLPAAIGMLWGDPIGVVLWVVGIRLVLLYHATFTINSLAHTLGSQPYSEKVSARDCFITAMVSMGEGYHNFHHRFPADYRNGIRGLHFDPTKWWVWTLSKIGFTWDLKRTSKERIEAAKLEAAAIDPVEPGSASS